MHRAACILAKCSLAWQRFKRCTSRDCMFFSTAFWVMLASHVWFCMALNCHVSSVFLLLMSLHCQDFRTPVKFQKALFQMETLVRSRAALPCIDNASNVPEERHGNTCLMIDGRSVHNCCDKMHGQSYWLIRSPEHVLYRRIQFKQSQSVFHPVSVNLRQSNSFAWYAQCHAVQRDHSHKLHCLGVSESPNPVATIEFLCQASPATSGMKPV